MDFSLDEERLRFKQEVADFCLRAPRYRLVDPTEESFFSPEYYRDLATRGWIGLHWPREYGGQGRSWMDLVVFNERMGYHRAPIGDIYYGTVGLFGDFCASYGSERHKKDYLPRIARGEIRFARAYTEPDAGYDLASIRTYARPAGDDYVITGQKRFITGANVADYLFLMARTELHTRSCKGLSFFIVDTKTPGITVSPIWSIAMRTNDVFLDNVRVPGENLIGEKGEALEYIDKDPHFRYETSLGFDLGSICRTFERFVLYVKENNERSLSQRAEVRQGLAEIAIDIEVSRLMTYRVAWMRSQGLSPQYEIYVQKLCQAMAEQRLANAVTEMLGLSGQLEMGSKYTPLRGMMLFSLRASLLSFLPGSAEILRNSIATKRLGLPA
jgi:hypothetical protein